MKKNHSKTKVASIVFAVSSFMAGLMAVNASFKSGSGTLTNYTRRSLSTPSAESVDPSEYAEISTAQLTPKIVSYTGTSLSRHLNVQFESQVLEGFASNAKDVFYVIDDSRYSGTKSDPFIGETPEDKTLNGFVYQAKAGADQTELYISNTISYGTRFTIKNTKVGTKAMYQTIEHDVPTDTDIVLYDAYKNLTTIYICDGVEEIISDAFIDVPDTVTFKCVAPSKPEGWADDWTDADESQIEWGAELADPSKAAVRQSGSTTSLGEAEDFILGYKGNKDIAFGAYPLTISYVKSDAQGNKTTEYQSIPTKHQTNPYDAVGSKIYGKTSSFEVTINVEKGETIDEESYEFYNVFRAKRYYIEEKEKWPEAEIKKIFENYKVPYLVEETEQSLVPALDGQSFFHQLFETETDKYLTIAHEFETEEEANALLNQFNEKITSFKVDKAVYETEEDLSYSLLSEYDESKYGLVYKLLYNVGEVRTNIFVQFYTFLNADINKYEFVSYIILDNPIDEIDSEGNKTGRLINSRSPFPIVQKAIAVRPFIYVPEYEEIKDGGVVTSRVPSSKLKVNAVMRASKMINIDELITTKYLSASRFMSFTSIGMTVDKVLGTAYAGYAKNADGVIDETGQMRIFTLESDGKYYNGANAYEKEDVKIVKDFKAPLLYIHDNSSRNKAETNLNAILAGEMRFRYTFTSLNMASLIVIYNKNGSHVEKEVPITSPSPVIEINQDKNNVVSFLINNDKLQGIDSKDILAVGVSGMTINVHLYNATSHNVVQNTQFNNIFGNIEILPVSDKALKFFDINIYLIIFFLALAVVYAALAVVLFFYKKNKYKNDEFRRMRPKAYIKSAILGFIGLVLVSAAINFIILRFSVFFSTVPTFNPIDAFVIGFGVFGAIAVGFFIKNAVVAIKVMKKRQQAIKLHLDKDEADDGTK